MSTKIIPLAEYEALWKELSSKRLSTSPSLDPQMKRMTVIGLSGTGTKFANEYERLLHEHNNPPMPRSIRMIGLDGEETIVPQTKKSTCSNL